MARRQRTAAVPNVLNITGPPCRTSPLLVAVGFVAVHPSLAAFGGPYSPHGEISRLAERQGPGAPNTREGGARALGTDRARAGEAAQSRYRQGDRGRGLGHRRSEERRVGKECRSRW